MMQADKGGTMSKEDDQAPDVFQAHAWLRRMACAICFLAAIPVVILVASAHKPLDLLIPGGMVCLGTGWLWSLFRVRLRLWPDRWEFRGIFRSLSGRRLDVAGYRWHLFRVGDTIEFTLKGKDGRPSGASFTLPDYRDRPGFNSWIAGLPDLTIFERDHYEGALQANAAFGPDAGRRRKAIIRHRGNLTIVNAIGVLAAVWVFVLPSVLPSAILLLCTVIPLVAIVAAAMSGGRYAVTHTLGNPKLSLFVPAFVPGVALAARFLADRGTLVFAQYASLDRWHVTLPAIACATVLTAIVGVIDRRLRLDVLGLTVILLFAYSFGALLACDQLADTNPGTTYAQPIQSRDINETAPTPSNAGVRGTGGAGFTSYVVQIDPWGPRNLAEVLPTQIEVNAGFYRALQPNDRLCMTLHPGALGWRWYTYSICPRG